MRYRIGPAAPWSAQLGVDHHEGVELDPAHHPWGQTFIRLMLGSDTGSERYLHPIGMELVQRADGGAALVITTARVPSVRFHGHLSEQSSLGHVGNAIGGVADWAPITGDHARSIVYAIPSTGLALNFNYTAFVDAGGFALSVPANQTVPGELQFFAGSRIANPVTHEEVQPFSTFRAVADLSTGSSVISHRRSGPAGRFHFSIASSILDPNVLFTSSNDGGFAQDGFLTTCPATARIVAHFDPFEGCPGSSCGNDQRGSIGMILGDGAQWPHATDPGVQYLMGARRPPGNIQSVWSIAKIDVGSERCVGAIHAPGPDLIATWFLAPPPDRFGGVGRGFFQTAHTDEAYNDEHDMAADWDVVFAARVGTPGGVVVLRRDLIEAWFETTGPGGGPLPDGAVLDLDPAVLPPGLSNPILQELDTHPELANVPSLGEPGSPGNFMGQHPALAAATLTVHPQLFKVPGPGSLVSDTWVLGVPCGTNVADPDLFATLPGQWAPDPPYDASFNHALVQFWEVQDPAAITASSSLPVLVGDDELGSAFYMETVEADLDPTHPGREVYAFVADAGGRVLVYDVTRLLQATGNQPVLVERWLAPPAVSDGLPSTILNLAVDHQVVFPPRVHVYVPVMRNGIAVLSFDPQRPVGQRLLRLRTIQTPGETFGVALRLDPATGAKTLLVTDHSAGVRIYGTPP
ncbi:MAG: hypothetical protein E2O39_17395 [Planctomycetota bacterium]|nr:MAG: hypothetical protein E2O39_17395 [Planctomycetota bacterium]